MTTELGPVVAGALAALLGALIVRLSIELWRKVKFELEYLKHPRFVTYSSLAACQGPHAWTNAKLAMRGLPVGTYAVCTDCGTIQGNDDVMVSREVLKQMKEAIELQAKADAEAAAVTARVEDLADAAIEDFIEVKFARYLTVAGVNADVAFEPLLWELVRFAPQAVRDALEKVSAELQHKQDMEAKYKNWPERKGNA